jgi:hypothetical protein
MILKSLAAACGAGNFQMRFKWVWLSLLLAAGLSARAASGQDLSKRFAKNTLSNGCVVWLLKTDVPTEILSHEGACKDKLAVGDWLFGAHQPGNSAAGLIAAGTVYLGRVENGAADSGLWMTFFGDRGGITVYDSEKQKGGVQSVWFIKGFSKRDAGFSKPELAGLIDKAMAVSGDKRLPTPDRDKLLAVANQWYDAPQQFTEKWLNPVQSNRRLADDPKVFGRSARGG